MRTSTGSINQTRLRDDCGLPRRGRFRDAINGYTVSGAVLIFLGTAIAWAGMAMDTTATAYRPGSDRLHNIGLVHASQVTGLAGIALFLTGPLFLATGAISRANENRPRPAAR